MIFTIIFVLVGVAVWVAAGGLLIYRRRQLRKTELMRQVETSGAGAVSGAAPGTLVELKGTLRCDEPLTSEMAEHTCAYYLSQVIREYEETDRDSDGPAGARR